MLFGYRACRDVCPWSRAIGRYFPSPRRSRQLLGLVRSQTTGQSERHYSTQTQLLPEDGKEEKLVSYKETFTEKTGKVVRKNKVSGKEVELREMARGGIAG